MLDRPTHIPPNDSPYIKPTKFNQNQANNHGTPDNRILLEIPPETLTGITSYLDPPSLFSLARVHSRLASHVKNDNIWHRAFVCQFLGISPESEINDDAKSLMLRRSETTWRNEYIVRYRLKRRWERSRNPTVTHIPVHSEISGMHLMANTGLLTSSIRYGVVARSLPLNGKILPGYLDASGLRLGLGVGNPNAEFTPNVSVCAITSDGGTAKILWGFQHGEIGILTAPRTIDIVKRPISEMKRCNVEEEHLGPVLDAVWDDGLTVVASGGADGILKIWDAKTMRCLWMSEPKLESFVPDAYLKIAVSVFRGLAVAVAKSGEIVAWTGLQFGEAVYSATVKEIRIPCPVKPADSTQEKTSPVVSVLRIDTQSTNPTILVAFEDDPFFYRLSIVHGTVETTTFGDAAFGSLSSIVPFFSSTEPSFILAGDRIGCVNIYAWNTPYSTTPIRCVRKFEASEDGAHVTALAWNGVTLITGSDRGITGVWDGLTFEHLHSFPSPVPRGRGRGHYTGREKEPVRQILVSPGKDLLLVSVGDRVLACIAGPVPRIGSGGVRGRHASGSAKKKKERIGEAKYMQQIELHETILESKTLLKQESEYVQRAHDRAREQHAKLETMGLDEAEALEYVLMVSREEALRTQPPVTEDGVFENFEFDDVASSSSYTNGPNTSHLTPVPSGTSTPKTRPTECAALFPSTANLSPPEAEWGECRSISGSSQSSDETHFPPISASASPPAPAINHRTSRSNISRRSSNASQVSTGTHGGSASRSPSSAWAVPLRGSVVTRSPVVASPSSSSRSDRSLPANVHEEDENLRFVLELSLAEARSRGEVV
ncbi:hypothetical protein DXG01_003253 [Tephrocybe rancida]|nr:hypothetical protein DXG01_003253 [Tephrocybe rancida]